MANPLCIGGVAGVLCQFGTLDDGAEFGELSIVAHGHNDVVFGFRRCIMSRGDFKHLIRHDVGVGIARPCGHLVAHEVVGAHICQHRHLYIQQGHVQVLTFAGTFGMAQRRQNRHRGVHAGEQVGHSHAYFLGAAA